MDAELFKNLMKALGEVSEMEDHPKGNDKSSYTSSNFPYVMNKKLITSYLENLYNLLQTFKKSDDMKAYREVQDEIKNIESKLFASIGPINNDDGAHKGISVKYNKSKNVPHAILNSNKLVTEDVLPENIEKHDTLNPLLFEGNELKPEIKEAIEKIVNQFVEDLKTDGVKIEVKDVILVGSNVSYNYTKDSDLDIHIIVDKDTLDCDPELYTLLYGAYRSLFNKNYDITIKGIPVEIYVELY